MTQSDWVPSNDGKLYFFNFSPWRMMMLEPFFDAPGNEKHICKDLEDALSKGMDARSKIFIFGALPFERLEAYAQEHGIAKYRIEDALIRSVALGSGFARPYSLIIDSRGVYFDPRQISDLEWMLQNGTYEPELIERARQLRRKIVTSRLSKYNHLQHKPIEIDRDRYPKVILVVGQVEDDMSIIHGAFGMTNEDLLVSVRENNPEAYLIYKPHPDVLSGNRKGHIDPQITERNADAVLTDVSIDSCIDVADEVHTLTSGSGFDALLREKKVFTYGMPFYAGWGLTEDQRTCERRTRRITLDELVAATLIFYPRYISPRTLTPCEPEQMIDELITERKRYEEDRLYRSWMQVRGYLLPRIRRGIRGVLRPFGLKI